MISSNGILLCANYFFGPKAEAMCRLLLGKGQSLYMVSPRIYKSTPVHWAAYCNATDILHEIGALVTNDQQLTELFALKDWLNMTVIHMAAYQGHVAALLVLLEYELAGRYTRDIFELKDVWGKTAVRVGWASIPNRQATSPYGYLYSCSSTGQ